MDGETEPGQRDEPADAWFVEEGLGLPAVSDHVRVARYAMTLLASRSRR